METIETPKTDDTTETKKSGYTEAQKRATKKYRENNRDKVNAQRKIYYEQRKAKDPDFLAYKRNKAKEYYQKMKAYKEANKEEAKEVIEDCDSVISVIDELPEKVEEPEIISINELIDELRLKSKDIEVVLKNKPAIFCRNKKI